MYVNELWVYSIPRLNAHPLSGIVMFFSQPITFNIVNRVIQTLDCRPVISSSDFQQRSCLLTTIHQSHGVNTRSHGKAPFLPNPTITTNTQFTQNFTLSFVRLATRPERKPIYQLTHPWRSPFAGKRHKTAQTTRSR